MAHVLPFTDLVRIAEGIGINLDVVQDSPANLYVLVDDQDMDLYVGKAKTERRHLDEDRWFKNDHTGEIISGIVSLARENNAVRRRINYDPAKFQPEQVLAEIDRREWHGSGITTVTDRLNTGVAPTFEEVEQILIRIHIRAGRLLGNSQFASQWESPIGSFTDTMAALAVSNARYVGIIPPITPATPENLTDAEAQLLDDVIDEEGDATE